MEQMASRPFSQVLVEIELREKVDLCSNTNPATLRKRKKVSYRKGIYYICIRICAIFQVVSLWLPTMSALVQSKLRSSGISGGQCGRGAGFL
jgi:hypothetical protein